MALIRPGCHKAGFERRCLLQGRTTTNTQESPCLQVSPTRPPTIFLTLPDPRSPPTSRSTIPPDEPNPDLRGLPVFPECSAAGKNMTGVLTTWKDLDSLITGPGPSELCRRQNFVEIINARKVTRRAKASDANGTLLVWTHTHDDVLYSCW